MDFFHILQTLEQVNLVVDFQCFVNCVNHNLLSFQIHML